MDIKTDSGIERVNSRSHYGKWLQGYISTSAWSGEATISTIWDKYKDEKPDGCSWRAWGVICGRHFDHTSDARYYNSDGTPIM